MQKEIKYGGIQRERRFFFSTESVGGEWWVEYFVYYLSILESGTRNESFFILGSYDRAP